MSTGLGWPGQRVPVQHPLAGEQGPVGSSVFGEQGSSVCLLVCVPWWHRKASGFGLHHLWLTLGLGLARAFSSGKEGRKDKCYKATAESCTMLLQA